MIVICGAERQIVVEEKTNEKRLEQEAFVTQVDGQPVGDSQNFVGVGVKEANFQIFAGRCRRCVGNPTRGCDINTRTFQHPEPQV